MRIRRAPRANLFCSRLHGVPNLPRVCVYPAAKPRTGCVMFDACLRHPSEAPPGTMMSRGKRRERERDRDKQAQVGIRIQALRDDLLVPLSLLHRFVPREIPGFCREDRSRTISLIPYAGTLRQPGTCRNYRLR